MRPIQPLTIAFLLVAMLLLYTGGGVPTIIGEPPPFKSSTLGVLIVEESTARGNYTIGQREAITSLAGPGSVREYVSAKKGNFLTVDKDNSMANAEQWAQDARKAVPSDAALPWITAATPRSGLNKKLPEKIEDTMADIKRLGGE